MESIVFIHTSDSISELLPLSFREADLLRFLQDLFKSLVHDVPVNVF